MNKTYVQTIALLVTAAAALADSDSDYGRSHIGGNRGPIVWQSLLAGDGLDGWDASRAPAWSREGDTIVADAGGEESTRLVIGDASWDHFEFSVHVTPVRVSALEILFGMSPDQSEFYNFNYLGGWKALAISHKRAGERLQKLDVVNFVMDVDQEQHFLLIVRDRSITTYVDGVLINRLTLDENPAGAVALSLWGRSTKVRFRDPKVRHYN